MLRLALLLLVTALAAGFCGFGLVADLSFAAARLLFGVFLLLSVLAFAAGLLDEHSVDGRWLER